MEIFYNEESSMLCTGVSIKDRSSDQSCSVRKDVFRKFAKSTGKHLSQSLFFYKIVSVRSATFLKKRLWHRCFPVNFVKILRTQFFTEHLQWLLLNIVNGYELSIIFSKNSFTDVWQDPKYVSQHKHVSALILSFYC